MDAVKCWLGQLLHLPCREVPWVGVPAVLSIFLIMTVHVCYVLSSSKTLRFMVYSFDIWYTYLEFQSKGEGYILYYIQGPSVCALHFGFLFPIPSLSYFHIFTLIDLLCDIYNMNILGDFFFSLLFLIFSLISFSYSFVISL